MLQADAQFNPFRKVTSKWSLLGSDFKMILVFYGMAFKIYLHIQKDGPMDKSINFVIGRVQQFLEMMPNS